MRLQLALDVSDIDEAVDFYAKLFYGGVVPIKIKEMTQLRLSKLHGCHF